MTVWKAADLNNLIDTFYATHEGHSTINAIGMNRVIDPAHIMMVQADRNGKGLLCDASDDKDYLGVSIEHLKRMRINEGNIELFIEKGHLHAAGEEVEFKFPKAFGEKPYKEIPLTNSIKTKFNGSKIHRIANICRMYDIEYVEFGYSNSSVTLRSSEEKNKPIAEVTCGIEDGPKEDAITSIPNVYLSSVANSVRYKDVRLEFSANYPVDISYLTGEANIKIMIAPKLEVKQ